jgi:hypothetical protein
MNERHSLSFGHDPRPGFEPRTPAGIWLLKGQLVLSVCISIDVSLWLTQGNGVSTSSDGVRPVRRLQPSSFSFAFFLVSDNNQTQLLNSLFGIHNERRRVH